MSKWTQTSSRGGHTGVKTLMHLDNLISELILRLTFMARRYANTRPPGGCASLKTSLRNPAGIRPLTYHQARSKRRCLCLLIMACWLKVLFKKKNLMHLHKCKKDYSIVGSCVIIVGTVCVEVLKLNVQKHVVVLFRNFYLTSSRLREDRCLFKRAVSL